MALRRVELLIIDWLFELAHDAHLKKIFYELNESRVWYPLLQKRKSEKNNSPTCFGLMCKQMTFLNL